MIRFTVTEEEAGKRLDSVIPAHIEDLSRSSIQKLCDEGHAMVNKKVERGSKKLHVDDRVRLDFDPGSQQIPDIDLPILYEDKDCLVINKPIGVLTHSKGAFNPEATVATFVSSRVKGMDGERAGIVHRLDRATSGVMIVAKTPEALKWLQKQFSSRKVKKTYKAIVLGLPEPQEAIIEMPIERNPKKPQTFRVGSGGKPAVTHYKVEQSNEKHSLLALAPTTGRTHQLRVHMNKLGHPIVGDTLYGGEEADRLYLHAETLELTLPGRQRLVFEAPLPIEFMPFMEQK